MPRSSHRRPNGSAAVRSWDPSRQPGIFYYEELAPGWPEIILCLLPKGTASAQAQEVIFFCETEGETKEVCQTLLHEMVQFSPVEPISERLQVLSARPSRLSEQGVAIYPPKQPGAPWLYVEVVNDPARRSLSRGRYDWKPFGGFFEADAHLKARHRVLFAPVPESASYRSRSMMLPTLPPFMPGPWE
ncbi:MAG: hypothetical protein ACRCXM_11925 [Beijerinckiaceae bacterium]|uniref:hypothetical protein n=1 Tax=Tabrizicola sp. TaxID=2005166 RepID=UPI003F2E2BF5